MDSTTTQAPQVTASPMKSTPTGTATSSAADYPVVHTSDFAQLAALGKHLAR